MNSYISTASPRIDRTAEPAGYVSSGRPAATPTGYVSPAVGAGAGSYINSEWVTAA